jgi:hypothetical protein
MLKEGVQAGFPFVFAALHREAASDRRSPIYAIGKARAARGGLFQRRRHGILKEDFSRSQSNAKLGMSNHNF